MGNWFRHKGILPVLVGIFLLCCVGCGSSSPAEQLWHRMRQAPLRDATFTAITVIDGAQETGTGTVTLAPLRWQMQVQHTTSLQGTVNLQLIDDQGITIFQKLASNTQWSIINDGDEGYYTNHDDHLLDYGQLHGFTMTKGDPLNEQATWHLSAQVTAALYAPDGTVMPAHGTETVWVREADAFPLAVIKTLTADGSANDGVIAHLSLHAEYTFTAWNTGVSIALPPPSEILVGS